MVDRSDRSIGINCFPRSIDRARNGRPCIGETATGAETTHATVLFADMRGYTTLAERLPPARVVCLLEEFFAILARVTVAFGGEVFHMAGDGMMAGFGVREPKRVGACAALAAGHAMLKGFAPVAARWGDEFSVATGIGIGLHSREVAGGCRPCVFRAPFIKPVRTLENGVDAPALATLRARASLRSAAH